MQATTPAAFCLAAATATIPGLTIPAALIIPVVRGMPEEETAVQAATAGVEVTAGAAVAISGLKMPNE